MSKSKDFSAELSPANFKLSGQPLEVTVSVEDINNAITQSIDIHKGAKEPIMDFISQTFENWKGTMEDLLNITPPNEIAEYWDIVIQLIQTLN